MGEGAERKFFIKLYVIFFFYVENFKVNFFYFFLLSLMI